MDKLANYVYNLVISHFYYETINIRYSQFFSNMFSIDWTYHGHHYSVRVSHFVDNYLLDFTIPRLATMINVSSNSIYIVLHDYLTKYAQIKPRVNI